MSYCFLFKYIIIGDSGTGKSCLLLRFTDKRYREQHQVTIGVEFGARTIQYSNNNIKLQIWDTAGQESFKAITRGYYKFAIGAVLCYDITNRESFENIVKWMNEAKAEGPEDLQFVLVGNKTDQQKDRKVKFEEGLRLAKQNRMPFLECSAKIGTNVQTIFTTLTQKVVDRIESLETDVNSHPGIKIGTQKYVVGKKVMTFEQAEETTKLNQSKPKAPSKASCCSK